MTNEIYLNHPSFGLLYRVCLLGESRELFTTLYAQRLFFIVTIKAQSINFEPITRSDARLLVDRRLRELRSSGENPQEYQKLQTIYQKTF